MREQVTLSDLGLIRYADALRVQQEKQDQLTHNKLNGHSNRGAHFLYICEHPPVITLGKSGEAKNLLLSRELLEEKGIEFYPASRGGDITYHGPGQIVGYPVLDLELFFTDIKKYMRLLEEVIMLSIAEFGLKGFRIEDATGVWVDSAIDGKPRKIAAFGVKMSRWVTMHGFALNVDTDLSYFDYIVPCGIPDKGVTSLREELRIKNYELRMDDVKRIVLDNFSKVFDVQLINS
jgi:lipoyl(octanoyl) transferase